MPAGSTVPPDLLLAVSERSGRVALIVGGGCSLEEPTGLELSSVYSLDVHRRLIADNVLKDGDCLDTADLSAVATAVFEKHGRQAPVVERLPRTEFRLARPNDGYLLTAALLREGAIMCVLTLNFDIALSTALGELSATEVDVVAGPAAAANLGKIAVIYLHRNVDELNPERWILRKEALMSEWQDSWEEVVALRVVSSPIVVFAGLGSRAAVLTESVKKIRAAVDVEQHKAFVVDPLQETPFATELDLALDDSHIGLGWCDFMGTLGDRLLDEIRVGLESACVDLCTKNQWDEEISFVTPLCSQFYSAGLVTAGKQRASWLLEHQAYLPDDDRRILIADLLLGVGVAERSVDGKARFYDSGVVEVVRDGSVIASFLAASGRGVLRWLALEAQVQNALTRLPSMVRPGRALLGGMQGTRPAEVAAPEDVIWGDVAADIVQGETRATLLTVDEIRSEPDALSRLIA